MSAHINQQLKECNPEVHFLCSYSDAAPLGKPVFFYHIPKTGGLAVSNTIGLASQLQNMHAKGDPHRVRQAGATVRIGSEAEMEHVLQQLERFPNANVSWISGHMDYGIHKRYPKEMELVTIIRDPIKRVKSAYTYSCMRAMKTPSHSEFEQFMRQPDNCNLMTRQLHPDGPDSVTDPEQEGIRVGNAALNAFDTLVLTDNIHEVQEYYLSRLGLPCVAYETINKTLPDYRLDLSDYDEQLEELNAMDRAFYETIKTHCQIPRLSLEDETINPLSVGCFEVGDASHSEQSFLPLSSEYLAEQLVEQPEIFTEWRRAVEKVAFTKTPFFRQD